MVHIKVINEPTELVPILRALDSPVKREVFDELIKDWHTIKDIEDQFGDDGKDALEFFEKTKLVEVNWTVNDKNEREKTYRSYYYSFHINTSCQINEMKDILTVAIMGEDEFLKFEKQVIKELNGTKGKRFVGDMLENLDMTSTMLKSIVKRSTKLEYRGQQIELSKKT